MEPGSSKFEFKLNHPWNLRTDDYGMMHTYLPGGAFTFKMRNVTYAGTKQHANTGALVAPQHCGMESHNSNGKPGATCNVHYLLENVDLTRTG